MLIPFSSGGTWAAVTHVYISEILRLSFSPKAGPISTPGIASTNWGDERQHEFRTVTAAAKEQAGRPRWYLQQLSVLPGLADHGVNVPPQQEEHHDHDHEQPGEEEAETRTPATTTGSEIPSEGESPGQRGRRLHSHHEEDAAAVGRAGAFHRV